MSEANCKPLPPLTEKDEQRFWKYVYIGPPSVCWPWMGALSDRGYGVFETPRATVRATRIAFYIRTRTDPFPDLIRHSCDNPPCCNPDHLIRGTHEENMDDMRIRERAAIGTRNGSRKSPHLLKRGSEHGMSKLTENAIREIRAARATGATLAELAKTYGVAVTNISSIVNRKTWNHVI